MVRGEGNEPDATGRLLDAKPRWTCAEPYQAGWMTRYTPLGVHWTQHRGKIRGLAVNRVAVEHDEGWNRAGQRVEEEFRISVGEWASAALVVAVLSGPQDLHREPESSARAPITRRRRAPRPVDDQRQCRIIGPVNLSVRFLIRLGGASHWRPPGLIHKGASKASSA